MFEMTVENVRANKSNIQQAMVLKARTVGKYLPILIGSVEANPISLKVLASLGVDLQEVQTRLQEEAECVKSPSV